MKQTLKLWPKTAALLCACWFAGSVAAPHSVPDTTAQRVQACTACHGKEGVASREGYLPRIAGKPAGYLYNQLLNFRDGRRHNGAMDRLMQTLSDGYLLEIAGYFAALDLPYPPAPQRPASLAEIEQGTRLLRVGDASRGLPACTQCHGATMTGVAPAIPGLLGLPRAYLMAQLGAWRNGQRRAQAPDCMADISQRLTAEELSAVATMLSMQALPADPKPTKSLPQALPIACGGVPR